MEARITLVIGYGSELRGDDALGPIAAWHVEQQLDGDPSIVVLVRPSLTPELAADLAAADRVVFIDCAQDGPIGQVIEQAIAPRDDASMSMVHFLDPPALLQWTRQLYGRCPEAVMLSVAGQSFEIAEELSPAAKRALPQLVARAIAIATQQADDPPHMHSSLATIP